MKKSLIALSLGMFVSTAAFAEMGASGAYVALDGGQSKASDACTGVASGCSDTATAWRVAAGYNFTPMWGIEASYGDFGSVKYSGPFLLTAGGTTYNANGNGEWKGTAWQFSGTGTFAINEYFAILAKIGLVSSTAKFTAAGTITSPVVGTFSADQSSSKTTAGFGIGAQFNFNKDFGLRVQYEDLGKWGDAAKTGESKVSLISGGLVYRF